MSRASAPEITGLAHIRRDRIPADTKTPPHDVPARHQDGARGNKMTTRERILSAAILRFARQSYEETGLRDIAADVGVDVAYVHRCFGSKQKLFAEAVKAAANAGHVFAHDAHDAHDTHGARDIHDARNAHGAGDPSEALVRRIFARDLTGENREVGPLDIMMRSLSSPEAAGILRDLVLRDFAGPLSVRLGDSGTNRAVLIVALMTGIGLFRDVLRIEDLHQAEDEFRAMITHILREMTGEGMLAHRRSVK
jgi:AcrR family transcriptional regulator